MAQSVLRSLRSVEPHLPLALTLALVGAVYAPLTRIYFIADDFSNMLTILDVGALQFILQPFGGHMLMVRNAVFWLHHAMFGFDAAGYGWVALLTHLLNTWLFYRTARGFTGNTPLAALGAVLWGTSPLLEGALAWYSVYGHALSGTALLIVLDRVANRTEASGPVSRKEAALWVAALAAGATCFGVGIAIAITFPVVAALLLPAAARERVASAIVLSLPAVVVAMYYGTRFVYGLFYEMPAVEQMMHGLAFAALPPILVLMGHLLAVGSLTLVESFWFDAFSYPASGADVLALFALFLAAGAICSDAAGRRRIAGLLILSAAVYGFIALGRANVYVMFQVPMAQAGKTLRYHYAALIPLALTVPVALAAILHRVKAPASAASVAFAAVLSLVALAHATSGWNLDEHFTARAYVARVLATIDATVETVPAGGDVIIQNRRVPIFITGPVMGYRDIPGWAGLFLLAEEDNEVRGRRVRFVQSFDEDRMYRPENPSLRAFFAPPGTPNAR